MSRSTRTTSSSSTCEYDRAIRRLVVCSTREWTHVGGDGSGVYTHPIQVQPNRGWGSGVGVLYQDKALTAADGKNHQIAEGEWD